MYTTCTAPKMNERTEDAIRHYLKLLNAGSANALAVSWRRIARMEGLNQIHPTTLSAYARGRRIVNKRHRRLFGLPIMVSAPPCPTCGEACTFDCGTQSVKNKEDPRQLTRCTVYPTTAVDKIISDLYRVTGKTFYIMEDELEY